MGCTDRSRGQSAVVGYVLVIGLSLAVVGVVVTMGGMAITDVEQSAQASQAETSMTEFDSRAAQVALGDSPRQSFRLGGDGDVSVDEDAGRIVVRWVNETDSEQIADENLGAAVYETGDRRIAYQGGGVWRAENNYSRMVSPPEYHYRDRTLTFPIIRVAGNASGAPSSDQIDLRKTGFEHHFPNENRSNPLEGGHVQVEVTSDYHYGWKTFFETRTQGDIEHDPANQTVLVNLTVPFTETFEHGVAATAEGSDAIDDDSTSPHGGFDSGKTGVDRPSVSPQVEAAIDDCENGSCTDLSSPVTGTLVNDTYYVDGDADLDALEYDTSSGDIDVVVAGDLTFSGDSHDITGDNGNVTFYVNGSVEMSGNTEVNTGGDPDDLLVLVHSDGGPVSTMSGTTQFTGFIYAPNSELVLNGGGGPGNDNIVGAVVVERAESHGNGNVAYSGGSLEMDLDRDSISYITYLHVTENRVDVRVGGE